VACTLRIGMSGTASRCSAPEASPSSHRFGAARRRLIPLGRCWGAAPRVAWGQDGPLPVATLVSSSIAAVAGEQVGTGPFTYFAANARRRAQPVSVHVSRSLSSVVSASTPVTLVNSSPENDADEGGSQCVLVRSPKEGGAEEATGPARAQARLRLSRAAAACDRAGYHHFGMTERWWAGLGRCRGAARGGGSRRLVWPRARQSARRACSWACLGGSPPRALRLGRGASPASRLLLVGVGGHRGASGSPHNVGRLAGSLVGVTASDCRETAASC